MNSVLFLKTIITTLDKNKATLKKEEKIHCLQFLNYENQTYEREDRKTIRFKI